MTDRAVLKAVLDLLRSGKVKEAVEMLSKHCGKGDVTTQSGGVPPQQPPPDPTGG